MTVAIGEFQQVLTELAEIVAGIIKTLLQSMGRFDDGEARAFISAAYPSLITPYFAASSDLTTTWYDAIPSETPYSAVAPELAPVEQLAISGRWALTQSDPVVALQGSGTRAVFDTSRRTVLENTMREGVRWARQASPDACGFCRMLTTRSLTAGNVGAPGLYRSEATALAVRHTDIAGHDHCKCVAVPDRRGTYTPPSYTHRWLDDYNAVSRDADGYLLSPGAIAYRMEQRAAAQAVSAAA